MKVLLISSLLLAVATADTCSDCTAVVTTIAGRLMSEESLESQKAILVGGLCPGAEDVAQCEANLPEFWGMIAALLCPGAEHVAQCEANLPEFWGMIAALLWS